MLTGTVSDGHGTTCGENGRRALNQASPGCTLRGVVLVAVLLAAGGLGATAGLDRAAGGEGAGSRDGLGGGLWARWGMMAAAVARRRTVQSLRRSSGSRAAWRSSSSAVMTAARA